MYRIFLLFACLFLAACRIDSSEIVSDPLTVTYSRDRKAITEEITLNDPRYWKLLEWLAQNEEGWTHFVGTHIHTVEVRGKKFLLQFHVNNAILNLPEHRQYIKVIRESDYQFLMR